MIFPVPLDYPREFVRVVELGLANLEPWWGIFQGDALRSRRPGFEERYLAGTLIVFTV